MSKERDRLPCWCAGKTQITRIRANTQTSQKRVRGPCNGAIVSSMTYARHNLADSVINYIDDHNSGDSMEMEEIHINKRKFVYINILI
jgi:hypothetical protein